MNSNNYYGKDKTIAIILANKNLKTVDLIDRDTTRDNKRTYQRILAICQFFLN